MRALIMAGLSAFAILTSGTLADEPTAMAPVGAWTVETIGDAGVLDQSEPSLIIQADGRVNGSSGCNRYSGTATLADDEMGFGALASTRMACAGAVMEQERAFLSALESVTGWREDADGRLVLLGADGTSLMVLVRGTNA